MSWNKKLTITQVRGCSRLLAGLDCVVNWESDAARYFYYYPDFHPGLEAVYLNNGSGDQAWGVFGPAGAIFQVFDHESRLSPYRRKDGKPWPGMFEGVPSALLAYLQHPDIDPRDITLCVYREEGGADWVETTLQKPPKDADGGWWLLTQIHLTARDWLDWAQDYYSCEFPARVVSQVYKSATIPLELATKLVKNVEAETPFDYAQVLPELTRLGLA